MHDGHIIESYDALHSFRRSFYECLGRRADALFELTDAILAADSVSSPVHLSLEAPHRRGWGSFYAALSRGRIDAEALRDLLCRHPLAGGGDPHVYAVDGSVWPRCDAETSPERGYYYHPSRHSAGHPIVAGWAYQFIAQLNFIRESWTAPVDALRVRPDREADTAAGQIKALLHRLGGEGGTPLFVFDAGYDPVKLQQGLEDAGYAAMRVRAWQKMHPKVRAHEGRGSRGPLPIVVGTLILVEVERLPRGESRREPKRLWLWWVGPEGVVPDLGLLWDAYVRRFDLEHTFRFLKQAFGWDAPRVRHPEQADRWTWLVLAAFTQLRLARAHIADRRLPWERRYDPGRLTPVRVHRGVSALLGRLGTPAKPPKPCGRSPGRPKGYLSGRAERHPAIKNSA